MVVRSIVRILQRHWSRRLPSWLLHRTRTKWTSARTDAKHTACTATTATERTRAAADAERTACTATTATERTCATADAECGTAWTNTVSANDAHDGTNAADNSVRSGIADHCRDYNDRRNCSDNGSNYAGNNNNHSATDDNDDHGCTNDNDNHSCTNDNDDDCRTGDHTADDHCRRPDHPSANRSSRSLPAATASGHRCSGEQRRHDWRLC
jgi:hypothetical protein